jgi:hypothetical protein
VNIQSKPTFLQDGRFLENQPSPYPTKSSLGNWWRFNEIFKQGIYMNIADSEKLKLLGNKSVAQLNKKIEGISKDLEPIGEPENLKERSLTLIHYSENDNISEFVNNSVCSWTDALSDNPKIIEKCIGKLSCNFKAIYIIKCNTGKKFRVNLREHIPMREFLIPCTIPSRNLAVQKISYNNRSCLYEAIL